jgi:hypothetical protein
MLHRLHLYVVDAGQIGDGKNLLYVRRASKGGNVNNLISVLSGGIQQTASSATGVSFQEIDAAGTVS